MLIENIEIDILTTYRDIHLLHIYFQLHILCQSSSNMKLNIALTSFIVAASSISLSAGFTQQRISTPFAPKNLSKLFATVEAVGDDVETGNPSKSVFLTPESAKACIEAVGSPLYAYSKESLTKAADECLAFPNAYGLTVRYAMKASPNRAILQLFSKKGIHIDASSGFEVRI